MIFVCVCVCVRVCACVELEHMVVFDTLMQNTVFTKYQTVLQKVIVKITVGINRNTKD